jgi:hypothetical protein
MADIRIKDLTTLESASLTGDVFVIDGTTGTRKLSAFSPTFGGNATVTGTLTVNGATLTTAGDISVAADKGVYQKQGNVHKWTSDGTSTGTARADMYADSGGAFFIRTGGATQALTISSSQIATFASAVSISSTTASTTTSTGALVVGNGTSGGLGVGGNITLGGGVNIAGAASDPLPVGTSGIWTLSGSGLRINSAGVTFASLTGTTLGTATVTLNGTTASTTTSSGALVVSGGVGVAGNINGGGDITLATNTKAFYNLNYANAKGVQAGFFSRGTSSGWTGGLHFYSSNTNYSATLVHEPGNGDLTLYTTSSASDYTSSEAALVVTAAKQVQVKATTASTSTSSGALVVSGGVGVAGAIYAGGYASTASHARIGASGSVVALSAANNVDSGLPAAWNGNYGLGVYYSAASTNTILIGDGSAGTTIFATRTSSANTSRITIDNTNGNTTFAGAVAIGNTVNTVSPTSPNRTITMVIGGTTYYLAAKTTND